MRFDCAVIVASVLAFASVGAGCQRAAGTDPPADAGTDASTDTDVDADSGADSGTDADSDSDSDSDSDADTDSGVAVDSGSPYQIGVGGFLDLDVRNRGELLGFQALAQFFAVTEPYVLHPSKEILVAAAGVDTCELAYFDGSSGTAEGTLTWLTAGSVTLSSAGGEALLAEYEGGLVVNYFADLQELGIEPLYGEEVALSVSGDEAAGFEIDPLIALPELLEITAPETETALPLTALAIAWTGDTPDGTARVRLKASDAAERYEIECAVADDGEFEIPAELMEALPAGWVAELLVSRRRRAVHPIPGDLDFIATAEASSVGAHVLVE